MATSSPISFLQDIFEKVRLQWRPPTWAVQEVQQRIVLALNHVLQQEQEATQRLARLKGRVLLFQWRELQLRLLLTPAGLLDLADAGQPPDLTLSVTEASPMVLAQSVARGERPAVQIAGDVQLAAEVNWLVDHVRWDAEEDLARIVGDVPAHALAEAVRNAVQALRQWLPGVAGGTR